jgi:hypothetical protein
MPDSCLVTYDINKDPLTTELGLRNTYQQWFEPAKVVERLKLHLDKLAPVLLLRRAADSPGKGNYHENVSKYKQIWLFAANYAQKLYQEDDRRGLERIFVEMFGLLKRHDQVLLREFAEGQLIGVTDTFVDLRAKLSHIFSIWITASTTYRGVGFVIYGNSVA